MICCITFFIFFFFNDTATTEIYTLSLHDALPISGLCPLGAVRHGSECPQNRLFSTNHTTGTSRAGSRLRVLQSLSRRSEEHTSELQSRQYLVCRLLLEKKKKSI